MIIAANSMSCVVTPPILGCHYSICWSPINPRNNTWYYMIRITRWDAPFIRVLNLTKIQVECPLYGELYPKHTCTCASYNPMTTSGPTLISSKYSVEYQHRWHISIHKGIMSIRIPLHAFNKIQILYLKIYKTSNHIHGTTKIHNKSHEQAPSSKRAQMRAVSGRLSTT